MLDYESEEVGKKPIKLEVAKATPHCPFCGGTNFSEHGKAFQCLDGESIFLSEGTGVKIEGGVIKNLPNARNLPDELSGVKEVEIRGPFRGNAPLGEVTLPSQPCVAIAALKAGMRIEERTATEIFLIRR